MNDANKYQTPLILTSTNKIAVSMPIYIVQT